MQAENVMLKPGENTIELTAKATRVGVWNFKQVINRHSNVIILCLKQFRSLFFVVVSVVHLYRKVGLLVRVSAGQLQTVRNNNKSGFGCTQFQEPDCWRRAAR